MTLSTPTINLYSTAVQQPVVLTRLAVFLLQSGYAFVQTFPSAERSDMAVFDQQQCLLHCTIQATATDRCLPAPSVSPAQEILPEPLVALIQALVQACTGPSVSGHSLGADAASELAREHDDQR